MKLANCFLLLACCLGIRAQSQPDPKPEVAGVTVDSNGKPLRKTDLTLLPLVTNTVGEPIPSYSAVSASDGSFEFYGIPPGRYRLMADHAGYLRTRYGAKTPWGSGTVLTLRAGVPITGLVVRLAEQGVISGKIRQYDGPPGNLYLTLFQKKYQDGEQRMTQVASATAEFSGDFLFNKLQPGNYYLLANPMGSIGGDPLAGEELGVPTYYPGTPDQSAAEPITIRRGQTISVDLAIKKSRHFGVSGSLSGYTPDAGRASVAVRPVGDGPSFSVPTAVVAADGTFRFDRVPPGPCMLLASVQGPSGPRAVYQTLNVQGEVSGIVLQPQQAAALRGTFKVEGENRAVSKLRLGLRMSALPSLGFSTVSGADGSFTLQSVIPGRYRYMFLEPPPGAYLKSVKFGDEDALSGLDFTEPSTDAKLEIVFSYAAGQIEGVILDEQDKPAEGTAALVPEPARPELPWLYKTAEAGEGGRFEFKGIRPGKYRLLAWDELEPGSHMDPKFTATYEARSVAVEVHENERKSVAVTRTTIDSPPVASAVGR